MCTQVKGEAYYAFINPDGATADALDAAVDLCRRCPSRRGCAEDALRWGTRLDASAPSPANGVIAAGVVCRGTRHTARMLAGVAGVEMPSYKATRRSYDACVVCHLPMLAWSRDRTRIVPEGHVEHYARGVCQNCRSSYAAVRKKEAMSA